MYILCTYLFLYLYATVTNASKSMPSDLHKMHNPYFMAAQNGASFANHIFMRFFQLDTKRSFSQRNSAMRNAIHMSDYRRLSYEAHFCITYICVYVRPHKCL